MSPEKREAIRTAVLGGGFCGPEEALRWAEPAESVYAQGAADALAEARCALRATLTGDALFDALATIDGLPSAEGS